LVKVVRGNVRVTVDQEGKTRIHDKYVVSAPLTGRILRIEMRPGDAVEAGKSLLTMIEPRDPELLDARTVAQAEARVKAAEATLRQVEPELEKARAGQAFAESELTRMRKAFAGKGVTQSDVENAEMIDRQRSEELRSAKVSEEIAKFELEQARAALLRSRPRPEVIHNPGRANTTGNSPERDSGADLAGNGDPHEAPIASDANLSGDNGWNFPIYSPIDGRVLRVFQESSAVVTPGTPLIELGDPADLEVEIDVLSRDAVKIHPGDPVLLEHWGGKAPLRARVRVVEPSGFTKISTLGVEEQRVWVIADFVDPLEKRRTLGDAYRVEARIVIDEAHDVLKIPTSALFRVGTEPAVFKVENGVAHQWKVNVGRQNGLEAEILDGLSEGDLIVLHPSDQLEDGIRVRQR
ncbi:MAG TPA: HlyD family efflux transporter periplasmic adaptor subunit, partial [Lacipirellulaceae bacterium]|nr:HlyD family efflux transporter periplasmic adaptor subunit [Lacipirellulaceae bacterium]